MSMKELLRDKLPFLVGNLVLFIILGVTMLLIHVESVIIFCVFCIWFFPLSLYMLLEAIKYKRYYDQIMDTYENLEVKYVLPEVIKKPTFIEGEIVHNLIQQLSRDMNENVKYYRDLQSEYREYMEMWIHEVKTPISSVNLIIENNPSSVTDKINYQLNRIESYIEQVLYYARSNDVNQDYIVTTMALKPTVMTAIKKNARDIIMKEIKVEIGNIDKVIHSDSKWVTFILNQVIGNAIKYSKEKDAIIKVACTQTGNAVVLHIQDNGVGIVERDVPRVFDKGFTGENGRIFGKSTGIGLYLCRRLCEKLGLGIKIESKINEGTNVSIIFPIGRVTSLSDE